MRFRKDNSGAGATPLEGSSQRAARLHRLIRRVTLSAVAVGAGAFLLPTPVQAATTSPWWGLTSVARPSVLPPAGKGQLVLSVQNRGDAPAEGAGAPIVVHDTLPSGLTATKATGEAGVGGFGTNQLYAANCAIGPSGHSVSCEVAAQVAPYNDFEVRISVSVGAGAESGELNEFAVSGAGVPAATASRPISVGEETPFGLSDFQVLTEEEGGAPDVQAGSHPFQVTTVITLNQVMRKFERNGVKISEPVAPRLPKRSITKVPPGLIGNPTPIPQCTEVQFSTEEVRNGTGTLHNQCPPQAAVGVVAVNFTDPGTAGLQTTDVPLFNLVPRFGEPARFGFEAGGPVYLDTSLRSGPGGDYGVTITSDDITQLVAFLGIRVTFWGWPGDPRHDPQRGWECLHAEAPSCSLGQGSHPPFIFMPTTCREPLLAGQEAESWPSAGPEAEELPSVTATPLSYTFPQALDGCNRLPFAPAIHAEPTSDAATSPTGLNADLSVDDPGLANPEGLVQSQVKKAVVTLPEGFTTNPSVAAGLGACTEAAYQSSTVDSEPGTGCPEDSKIGDVEVETPLATPKLDGSLYVARQHENPFGNLLTLYMVIQNPELGVMIKAAGRVEANEKTGQLTTTFDNLPQLPFSHFRLSFRQGQRSPLITPTACGSYTVKAALYPYSDPTVPLEDESSFQITTGPEGQGCPSGGVPPFHPNLEAGTINNAAGTYSPFYTRISRKDSEQEITHFSIKLPPGVIGKLAGVAECSDAAIAVAKAREHEGGGGEEEASPSCPASSEVGHTLVGAGVGSVLAYAPGKVYLAGPYHGSQLSFVSITAAKVGPFDLGTVVVRFALRINPETAEVFVDATGSDPIPHIVDGIPVHLRDIRAYVDRPQFTLNPTSCEPTSTTSTVLGSGLDFVSAADDQPVTVSSPFQAADCASLPFKPKLKLSLKGSTKRGGNPALHAHLAMKGIGEAAVAYAQVALPPTEFLDNAHVNGPCTRAVFKEGAVEGEKCPPTSIIGHAKALTPLLSEPLEGPVYLRSNPERSLPDIAAALHGSEISVVLDGHTDSAPGGGLRNTFEVVPDAPVTSFDLDLFGGHKGLLENAPKGTATSICGTGLKAAVKFKGHNGKQSNFNDLIHAAGCHKHKKHKRHDR